MPAGPKSEGTIKKAIDSILDQDLKGWELIVVVNGEWKGRDKTIGIVSKYAKKDKRISLLKMKEGNACSARNLGAEMASGKYISFFSSDFMMYPGALTKWKEEFEAHKDADFIYSGYGLLRDGEILTEFVPTREFDPYLLEVANYIDGGFPMKREVWEKGKWDPKVKSLNDWDFWLTAVKKNGFKGRLMLDSTYAAEVPKEGGLSFDSHRNWLERMDYIKEKHGIPQRDLCVVSLGAPHHGIRIAKLLNADFQVAPQMKPNKYKAILLVGFYIGNGESAIAHTRVFEGFKGKQLIYWIGTDLLQLIGGSYKVVYADYKQLVDQLDKRKNLVEFQQAQGELESMGIRSEIISAPIENIYDITPLPKDFTVAIYVPKTATARQIYNLELTSDIVSSCPDIKFLVFGGGSLDKEGDNVVNVGWKPMKEIIDGSSMLLRLTSHDGMPIAPIEFRLAGRDAMTTVQMKYLYFAGNGFIPKEDYSRRKEGIIAMIRDIKKSQKKDGVKDRDEARKHYLDLCDPKKFADRIMDIVNNG